MKKPLGNRKIKLSRIRPNKIKYKDIEKRIEVLNFALLNAFEEIDYLDKKINKEISLILMNLDRLSFGELA